MIAGARLLCEGQVWGDNPETWKALFGGFFAILVSPMISAEYEAPTEVSVVYDSTFSRLTFASRPPEDPFAQQPDFRGHFCRSLQKHSWTAGVVGSSPESTKKWEAACRMANVTM